VATVREAARARRERIVRHAEGEKTDSQEFILWSCVHRKRKAAWDVGS